MWGNRDELKRNKQTNKQAMNVALDQSSLSQDLPSAASSCPHLCLKPPVASTTLQIKLRGLTVAQRPCRGQLPPSSPVSSPNAPHMDPAYHLLFLQLNFPSYILCCKCPHLAHLSPPRICLTSGNHRGLCNPVLLSFYGSDPLTWELSEGRSLP